MILLTVLATSFAACKEKVLHNLTELDANRVFSALNYAGISGIKEPQADGKWSVSVDSDDMVSALKVLNQNRIVKAVEPSANRKSSMISSREAQRFEYERNLSQEIEKTLLSIDGVLEARVHLNLPLVDPILGTKPETDRGSASVLLISLKDFTIDRAELAGLVSGASGIAPGNVAMLITNSEPAPQTELADHGPIDPLNNGANDARQFVISSWVMKIIGAVVVSALIFAFLLNRFRNKEKQRLSKLNSRFESARFS